MLPIILKLGPITLYSYGLLFLLGLIVGLYWWWRIGRDEHWEETALFDTYFVAFFSYVVFGRLGYVLVHPELYNVWYALSLLSHPGIMVSVGMVSTIVVVWLLARKHEWDVWKALDGWVVVLSTVSVIVALGAILNGTTPGLPSSTFGYVHAGDSVPRIPVDVWTFVWSLMTFGVVSRVRKNFRFYSWYKGEASVAKDGLSTLTFMFSVGIYLLIAGILSEGLRLLVIPIYSLGGLGLMIIASIMIYWRSGKNKK